jgi:hypothetical protein
MGIILLIALGISYAVLLNHTTTMTLACTDINYWENLPNATTTSLSTVAIYSTTGSFQVGNISTYTGSTFTESGSTPGQYWNETVCVLVH